MPDDLKRKSPEQSLRLFQFSIDHASDPIQWVGSTGRFLYVNEAGCRELGYSRDELLTMTVFDIDPNYQEESWPEQWRKFKEKQRVIFETSHRKKDGRLIPVEVETNYQEFEGRGYIFAHVRDISDRKLAEEQLQKSQAELTHALRVAAVGQMASSLAHELNQPLCSILSHADSCVKIMKSDSLSKEFILPALEQIVAQADRAGEIIRAIKGFVRKNELKRKRVNLNDLIRNVIKMVAPIIRKHGIDLELRLSQGLALIHADPIQIEQVILNLVQNGIDAVAECSEDPRRLILTTGGEGGDRVYFSIQDTGAGIPPKILLHIFEPFITTKASGLGMGLPISRTIIENHGGDLRYFANSDHGMTFCFRLPCEDRSE